MPRGAQAKNGVRVGVTTDQFGKWMGVTRQTVYNWGNAGLIVKFADGSIDPIGSCRKVDEAIPRPSNRSAAPATVEDEVVGVAAAGIVDPSLRGMSRSRLEHLTAMYKAEAARVALAVDKGELIPVAAAAAVFARTLEPAIGIIRNIPYRIGPRLVDVPDERRVIIALEGEVNNALRSIAAIDPAGVLVAGPVQGAAE